MANWDVGKTHRLIYSRCDCITVCIKTIQALQKLSLGPNKISQKGSLEPGEIVGKSDTKFPEMMCLRKRELGETEGLQIRFIPQNGR